MDNKDIRWLLIETLQYNASMVALCSLYFGNCSNARVAKKAQKDIINLQERYIKTIQEHDNHD